MLFPEKERRFYQLQAPLTSLIDIVFLLLVYFLLTTNFIVEEGIKVKLPNARAASSQTEKEITIVVDKAGRSFVDNREIPMDALFGELKGRLQGREDSLVVIKADRSVELNKAVRVMDVAKAAGAARLALATEKDF